MECIMFAEWAKGEVVLSLQNLLIVTGCWGGAKHTVAQAA
jgi:hypothetical protein